MTTEPGRDVVDFWLGASLGSPELADARREWWYRGGAAADEAIRARFGALVPLACERGLMDWETTENGTLALILLLDRFTRNLYRGTPGAYAGDALAYEIVHRAIAGTLDAALHPVARIWLYHPFHHSERIEDQEQGLALLGRMESAAPEPWKPYVRRSIEGWRRHRDIVARFGRFPHRNRVLGRTSTIEEEEFLSESGDSFGQGPAPDSAAGTASG